MVKITTSNLSHSPPVPQSSPQEQVYCACLTSGGILSLMSHVHNHAEQSAKKWLALLTVTRTNSFIHYETTLILLLATTLSFLVTFYMATLEIIELIARYSFAKTTQYTYQAREFHAIRIVVIKELNCI